MSKRIIFLIGNATTVNIHVRSLPVLSYGFCVNAMVVDAIIVIAIFTMPPLQAVAPTA